MGSRKPTTRSRLREYLDHRAPGTITDAEWRDLCERFAPASPNYLRRLLRDSGPPLAPLVEGVRQDSFEHLERTLLALEHEYAEAGATGGRERQRACRRAVIEAKDHARWAIRRVADPEKKTARQEMVAWMLVWLEDPPIFPAWVRLRKQAARSLWKPPK